MVRYSPAMIDVINLNANTFETVDLADLLAACGTAYPAFDKVFSVLKDEVTLT